MKILILGAGQVGRTAAQHLSREEANEVTVVDLNEDVLRDLQDRLDVRTVAGNAAHPTVLEQAGAAEAEIIVALTSSDEVNMMACEVAFTLFRTPTKIARIRAAEYTSRAALFGADGLSVDVFISPEQLVTEYVERLIHHPGTLQVLDFADGRVRLVGVRARRERAAGRAEPARAGAPPAEGGGARGGHLPRRPRRAARGRHRARRRRRGVLPRRARRHPPRHGGAAPGGIPPRGAS